MHLSNKLCWFKVSVSDVKLLQVLLSGTDEAPTDCAFENVNENLKVYLKVQGNLDLDAEREKIRNKLNDLRK